MKKGLIGKKIGMTQIFDEAGNAVPVTVVEAGPCVITQKKTMENDGYEAIQVGFGDVKVARVNKPMKGHFDKANVAPKKTLKELLEKQELRYESLKKIINFVSSGIYLDSDIEKFIIVTTYNFTAFSSFSFHS